MKQFVHIPVWTPTQSLHKNEWLVSDTIIHYLLIVNYWSFISNVQHQMSHFNSGSDILVTATKVSKKCNTNNVVSYLWYISEFAWSKSLSKLIWKSGVLFSMHKNSDWLVMIREPWVCDLLRYRSSSHLIQVMLLLGFKFLNRLK